MSVEKGAAVVQRLITILSKADLGRAVEALERNDDQAVADALGTSLVELQQIAGLFTRRWVDEPIRPRTDSERRALLTGYAMAIETVEGEGISAAREWLRMMAGAEGMLEDG